MKTLKILPLITGAIVAAAIAMTPVATLAQEQQQPPPQSGNSEIVLSPEQQAKFKKIREETRVKIEKVLSPAQITQLRESGKVENLSNDQKAELEKIYQSYLVSLRSILTPDQLQQIEQSQPEK